MAIPILAPTSIRSSTRNAPLLSTRLAYAAPQAVLRDSALSYSEKRDVLQRWALDAYLCELALSKGEAALNPSRLPEIIDALIDLDEPELRRILERASRLPEIGDPLAA
jgi:hypothetical protein